MSEFDKLYKAYTELNIQQSKEAFDTLKVEFVYHSNKLEGSQLTLIQTQALLEYHATKGEVTFTDQVMAVDHYRALNQALLFGANKYPLSEKIVLELNATLLKNSFELDPFYANWRAKGQELGAYKISTNRIKVTRNDEEVFLSTPSPERSKQMMLSVIEDYNTSEDHFLEKLALLVQGIYNAHPFIDGNKRITRLLIANQLIANGYPLIVVDSAKGAYNIALLEGLEKGTHQNIKKIIEKSFNRHLASIIIK